MQKWKLKTPVTEAYERAVWVLKSAPSFTNYGSLKDEKDVRVKTFPSFLERAGLKMEQIDKLNIIHVTGTKGKGSTCTYVDTILRKRGFKTGLFRTPHLVGLRDDISINGVPVSEELFTSALWHVFERLQLSRVPSAGLMPDFFILLILMAMHIFVQENVDAVVMEVGIGGEYDPTNFVLNPVVCGVVSLHVEHQRVLGHTVQEIAWHKAGIMKRGVPFVTVPQPKPAMDIIFQRAKEKGCPVFLAPPLQMKELQSDQLGIVGSKQVINAALAVQLCRLWLQRQGHGQIICELGDISDETHSTNNVDCHVLNSVNLAPEEKGGLVETRLIGRHQIVKRSGVTYYLDVAHTPDSIEECVAWFKESAKQEEKQLSGNVLRALLFRVKMMEKGLELLPYFMDCGFERVAFPANVVSVTEICHFPDAIDSRESQEKSLQCAAFQQKEWTRLQAGTQKHGNHSTPCLSRCFPSFVSGLWWVGLGKDTPLKTLAEADLSLFNQSQFGAQEKGGALFTDGPMVNGEIHVQVLVTGSMTPVGGALTLFQSNLPE